MLRLLVIITLLYASPAFATLPDVNMVATPAAVNGQDGDAVNTVVGTSDACAPCTGTYRFCWTGEYSGDTDEACTNSGAGTSQGTVTSVDLGAGYARTGSIGARVNATGDCIKWAITAKDIIDCDTTGTIWMDVNCQAGASNNRIFEAYGDANDMLYVRIGSGDKAAIHHEGGGTILECTSTNALTVDGSTWYTIGFSWDVANSLVAVRLCTPTMVCDDWDTNTGSMGALGTDPATLGIGQESEGAISDAIWIDNVYILSGYQTAHP